MPGLFDRLAGGVETLFGGRDDPRVSPEQNRAATSDALVNAGLATILAEGPNGLPPTTFQAIAQGVLSGRQAGTQSRETSLQQTQQEQLKSLIESGEATPAMLQDVFLRAVANGDTDSARALAEVIKSVGGSSGSGARRSQVVTSNGRQVLIDLNTGEKIADLGEAEGKIPPTLRFFDDEKGREVIHNRNPDGTAGMFLGFADEGMPSAAESLASGLSGNISDAAAGLDGIDQELTRLLPNLAARGGPILGGASNWLLGADKSPFRNPAAQKAVTDGLVFISFAVRHLSGAQMTEQETRRYHRALLPVFGDGEATIELKRRKRAIMTNAMGNGRWAAVQDAEGNWIYPDVNQTLAQIELEAAQIGGEVPRAGDDRPTVNSDAADALRN
jgi:hypothetical protein